MLEEPASDGDPAFVVRVLLADGRRLRLHGAIIRDGERAAKRAGEIRRFTGMPAMPAGRVGR